MTRRVSAKEARDSFADLIDSVHDSKEPVVLEEKGQPYAVVISPDDFVRLHHLALEDLAQTVAQIHEENRGVNPECVYDEVTDVVEQVRQGAYEREQRPQDHH